MMPGIFVQGNHNQSSRNDSLSFTDFHSFLHILSFFRYFGKGGYKVVRNEDAYKRLGKVSVLVCQIW